MTGIPIVHLILETFLFLLRNEFFQFSGMVLVAKHVLCVGLHVCGRHHLPKDLAPREIMVKTPRRDLWAGTEGNQSTSESPAFSSPVR